MRWSPITDLPADYDTLASEELAMLIELWVERHAELSGSGALREFVARLSRRWAIETGLVERLYTLDRGITQLLVEQGIDAALIPHAAASGEPTQVAAIIADQLDVAESLFAFVRQDRSLTTGYVKELHAALTRNQHTTTALTPDGRLVEVPLLKGDYKRLPNNPRRPDGSLHEYAPVEHVAAEMDRLVALHHRHREDQVPPEVECSWLHHRFTQIHPFQDGNGRVARALASLVFMRARGFPPVVRDEEDRVAYIQSLERADTGDLQGLVELFARREKAALLGAIGVSEHVVDEHRDMARVIAALAQDARSTGEEDLEGERVRAVHLADAVQRQAHTRMSELRDQLETALAGSGHRFYLDQRRNGDPQARWYRQDIIAFAEEFDYFANFEVLRSWTRLKLLDSRRGLQDEILIAAHGIGRQFRGGVAVVALSIRRETLDESGEREVRAVPLADEPFSLTYREPEPAVLARFARWLEPALLRGVEGFRRAVRAGG